MTTRTRTWSTAKSIAVTLIGMLVDEGRMALDEPLGFDWLPDGRFAGERPAPAITLRHVLNMSSGLYPIDNAGPGVRHRIRHVLLGRRELGRGHERRGLVREPGTYLGLRELRHAARRVRHEAGARRRSAYLEFPRRALLDRIGMRNTLLSTDRFGDFILSSQVYTNARDLARFGLLYLHGGRGTASGCSPRSGSTSCARRRRPPRTAATSTVASGGSCPTSRTDVPKNAYSTAGNRGQYVIVVPSHDLVIVRRGLDWGRQGFDRWDLMREVLKAMPTETSDNPE